MGILSTELRAEPQPSRGERYVGGPSPAKAVFLSVARMVLNQRIRDWRIAIAKRCVKCGLSHSGKCPKK